MLAALSAQAQDTYTNHAITQTADLYGTARYVGMGGATGALGADISGISLNPAGIGLFRRNDISLTAGFIRQGDDKIGGASPIHGSFDQIGAVFAFNVGDEGMRYVNFAFNYQKKADFHHTFFADNPVMRGLSLSTYMAMMSNRYATQTADGPYLPSSLSAAMYDAYVIDGNKDSGFYGVEDYAAGGCSNNEFTSVSEGNAHAFDFNVSGNYNDRFYWGLTLGVDYANYKSSTYYTEYCGSDQEAYDYHVDAWKQVKGVGVNLKLGFIGRPIEYSPLRLGVTLETPTFYSLKMDGTVGVTWEYDEKNSGHSTSYLDYNLRSPWRFRLSAGYTVGDWLALGADYEYAMYNRSKVAYSDNPDDWDTGTNDELLNNFTSNTLRGVHGVRLGAEAKVAPGLSLRAGYNYYGSAFKDGAYLAHDASDVVMDVSNSAHYMNLGDVNILTLGIGYKGKRVYADMAYKYRAQSGDFYAFDDVDLIPVKVNLDRHQMLFTLGSKF